MKDKHIDEKSSISIRFAIVVISVVVWMVRLSDKVDVLERTIVELQKAQQQLENRLEQFSENGAGGK